MKKISTLFIFFSLLLIACKKSAVEANPQLEGNILLADEGGRFLADNSGIVVSIENSNPWINTTSDSRGKFILPIDASLTSFSLVYSKPGFGIFKRYFEKDNSGNFCYWELNNTMVSIGKGQAWIAETLGAKSTVTVNSLHVAIAGDTLRLSCNISASGSGQKYIELLSQKDLANISINTVDKNRFNWHFLYPVKNGDNTFRFCLKCSALCNDWASGDVVYFTAYGGSYYCDMYIDRSNNSIVMPNLNTNSAVAPVSVVVP